MLALTGINGLGIRRLVDTQLQLQLPVQASSLAPLENPHATRNVYPFVIRSAPKREIFSDKDDLQTTLARLDDIWKDGTLFEKVDEPDSDFYRMYLIELTKAVMINHSHLVHLAERKTDKDGNTPFEIEFMHYVKREDLNYLQKSVDLTRALQMVLLGAKVTTLLKIINRHSGPQSSGARQELQAGWLKSKLDQLSPGDYFEHSVMMPTIRRNKNKKDYGHWVVKEVDILTENSIVSVKSGTKSYAQQARNLFYIILDDKTLGLQNKIKRIVLIKNAEEDKHLSLKHLHSQEYRELIADTVETARQSIKESGALASAGERLLNRLISTHGIEIYYTPVVNGSANTDETIENWKKMKNWIQDLYKNLDRVNGRQERIA